MKTILVCFASLFIMASCNRMKDRPTEMYHYSHGKCWIWDYVENDTFKKPGLCRETLKNGNLLIFCTRSANHKGRHHMHGMKDCYYVW